MSSATQLVRPASATTRSGLISISASEDAWARYTSAIARATRGEHGKIAARLPAKARQVRPQAQASQRPQEFVVP